MFGCNNQTEILLQKEEKSIHNEPTEFEFPETTSGSISFDYYINSGFIGSLLFQNQDEIVFEYQINTNRKLYPLVSEIENWQQISMEWNFENSSLNVFINGQLQTTRLIKSEKITSINKFILNPDRVKTENSITIKNVTCKGVNSTFPQRLKIVAFGNSTTAFRNTITGVYTQRLPGLLLKEGIPNIIYNEGVGGSHTGRLVDNDRHKVKHALDRLEYRVLAKKPDITVVCFGINDSWIDTGKDAPRIPLEDFEKNLKYIVETIQKEKSSVILMTPNALGKRHEKWRYDGTEKYVEVIRNIANQQKVILIDQWKIWENYAASGKDIDDFLLDGTHPNDIWHEQLAELLAENITQLIKNK
ncbi:MAG: hypothetical protein KAR17_21930 [Cyclobacteriaceae bacterium]|nr:hypothetical protein [Cyclobacteriaceae bacterium]